MKIDVTHSVWPWIAEHTGFFLTRFEVGRDGKTAYERLKGNQQRYKVLSFAEGILWKWRQAGGPLGKLTCMFEDGVYLGIKHERTAMACGSQERSGGRLREKK